MCKGVNHTVFASQIVMAVPLKIQISVGWASCIHWLLRFHLAVCYECVQEWHGTIRPGFLCGEYDQRSIEVMSCKNYSLCDCWNMTKVSSTHLFHNLGGFTADVMALYSIHKLSTMELTGDPMATPLVCYKIDLGTRSRCYINRIPTALRCGWLIWFFFWEVCILFQLVIYCSLLYQWQILLG